MWAAEKLALVLGLSCACLAHGLSSPTRAIDIVNNNGHLAEAWHALENKEHVGVQLALSAFGDFRTGVRRGVTGHLDVNDVNETAGGWDYRKAPPERQGEYFRPVSTTVYCVMVLTIECLCVYTALALSRNADELNGLTDKPSLLTDTLSTAARSIAYPPMMCMLFVACRMFVLATTEGLGEPQPWAKQAMITASAGMTVQFLVCLSLPLFTRHDGAELFSSRAGGNHDAHPLLKRHHFSHFGFKIFFWLMQMLCMVALYGGVFTVMYAIYTYPEGTTKVSAAVRCTVVISGLYFSVFGLLWLLRTWNEDFLPPTAEDDEEATEEDPDHPGWQRPKKAVSEPSVSSSDEEETGGVLGAAIQMSFVVRKGPMLAVLFLACRMRALQLDPPHGMPPPAAQMCFFLLTGALFAETLAAAIVGFTGKTSIGYYGTPLFQSSSAAHGMQYAIAFVIFCGLFPVYNAAVMMTDKDGKDVPLSTTVKCVFYFAALFFGIDFLKLIALLFQNVFKWTMDNTVQTFTSASIGVSFAPLLCILFVACRMRALQITQQQGSPQEWAQNCMFVCVFVTVLQMLCCLILPLFTQGASHVDPEGNVVYDLTPMIGAYCVTIVKYVSLFCLHGAVFCICCSIFLITPENAAPHGPPSFDMESLMRMSAIAMVIILLAMLMSSAKVIGLAVKFAIESADDAILGVQITVGAAALAVCRGYVNVSNVIVNNPEGKEDPETGTIEEKHWNTDYMVKIDNLVVKINIGRLICSMGKEFEITTVEIKGVQVNFDKPSLFSDSSNVQEVLDHLDKFTGGDVTGDCLDAEQKAEKEKKNAEAAETAKKAAAEAAVKKAEEERKKKEELERLKAEGKEPPPEESMPDIIIHEVNISEIGCACVIKGMSMRAVVGDIKFPDFMTELNKHGDSKTGQGSAVMGIVIGIIMRTLMASVMANVKPLIRGAVAGAGRAVLANSVGNAGNACKSIFGMLRRKLSGAPQPALGEPVKTIKDK